MIDRRLAAVALVVVASVSGVTLATAPAIAQEDESGLADVFTSGDAGDTIRAFIAGIGGATDRADYWIESRLPDFLQERFAPDRQTAEEEIDQVADYYNDHNATLESYVNSRGNFTENRTVKLTLHLRGDSAKRYLEADVDAENESVTTTEIVSSTDREITDTLDVCDYAADQSYEELRRFTEDYAEPDKDVDREYLATLAGKYGGEVETTVVSSTNGDCEGGS